MMPRLQAAEQLAAVQAAGLAFGGYEKRDADTIFAELRRKVNGDLPQVKRKATRANLAAMGIGVVAGPGVVSEASQKSVNDV